MSIFSGIGYDIHRLQPGRRLIIGGIEIPYDRGLLGHSDGDVVLHSVADAILGASGNGDIGEHFPDTDTKNKDMDSLVIIKAALQKARGNGLKPFNIDIIIFAEEPKLNSYKETIKSRLIEILGTPYVNIKAKTMEKLGEIGKGEAIACSCVVTLTQHSLFNFYKYTNHSIRSMLKRQKHK